jgi:hypothetical protein
MSSKLTIKIKLAKRNESKIGKKRQGLKRLKCDGKPLPIKQNKK